LRSTDEDINVTACCVGWSLPAPGSYCDITTSPGNVTALTANEIQITALGVAVTSITTANERGTTIASGITASTSPEIRCAAL
jgi:hypothetical protein